STTFQSARLTCLPLLRRNQRGAGFSVLADVPAAGCAGCAAMPCGFQSRSISSRVEACTAAAASNRVNSRDLMRDMSAGLLTLNHCLLPGIQRLTLVAAEKSI